MHMITPERMALRDRIEKDLKRFLDSGGKIESCGSDRNANYYGLPVTPSMSQRKRSSGGKPMHINPETAYANT